jgi:hypothetical protein
MEMILIVVLSVALGVLSTVFYFTCLRDKPVQFKFRTEKEDKFIEQIQAAGDNLVSVVKSPNNTKLTLRDRFNQIKEFSITHKTKVGFCVLFIVACIVGAWLGYNLMMNVNDTIKENKKTTTIGMTMIEPDVIKVKHLDDGSRIKYL